MTSPKLALVAYDDSSSGDSFKLEADSSGQSEAPNERTSEELDIEDSGGQPSSRAYESYVLDQLESCDGEMAEHVGLEDLNNSADSQNISFTDILIKTEDISEDKVIEQSLPGKEIDCFVNQKSLLVEGENLDDIVLEDFVSNEDLQRTSVDKYYSHDGETVLNIDSVIKDESSGDLLHSKCDEILVQHISREIVSKAFSDDNVNTTNSQTEDTSESVKCSQTFSGFVIDEMSSENIEGGNGSFLHNEGLRGIVGANIDEKMNIAINEITNSTLPNKKEFSSVDFQFDKFDQDISLECNDSRLDNLEDEDISYSAPDSVLPSPSTDVPTPHAVIPFEDESLSSIDQLYSQGNSRSQTPCRIEIPPIPVDEESISSVLSSSSAIKKRRLELGEAENLEPVTAYNVLEYLWPPDEKNSEYYMLQEQVCEYLGVKSFKRRYPDLKRRLVDKDEKDFLKSKGVINETILDMGLTALLSHEVFDIMFTDFADKYEELRRVMRDAKEKSLFFQKPKTTSLMDKARVQESQKNSARSAADWNTQFNRMRKEKRQACLDMQTFCVHYPTNRKRPAITESKAGCYPCALLPGQFSDYFKPYTPTELRYLPVNSVVYGPVISQTGLDGGGFSDGSLSPSDDSSSDDDDDDDDDDSCSSLTSQDSDCHGDKGCGSGLQCIICLGDRLKNKNGVHEDLVTCSDCKNSGHPSCIDISQEVVPYLQGYPWQCMDCKTCYHCKDPDDEDKMIFCDMCDRGYHIYCIGLRKVPTGRWQCSVCAVCCSCGSREPWGTEIVSRTPSWQFELVRISSSDKCLKTFCQGCHRFYKKNKYCLVCYHCNANPLETGMSQCVGCEKWIHSSCDPLLDANPDMTKNKAYMCFYCQNNGKRVKAYYRAGEITAKT